jgi:hypothetical protein
MLLMVAEIVESSLIITQVLFRAYAASVRLTPPVVLGAAPSVANVVNSRAPKQYV